MKLPEICIKRPVFTIVLSLIIMTLGGIFYTKLQIRGTPNIMPPIVSVTANYPGADALYMEKQITTRMEKELKTVKNLDYMSSSSSAGQSNITLSFKLDANIEVALNDVRSKISDLSNIFPDDMHQPSVSKLDADAWPSIWIAISSDRHDNLELTRIADDQINSPLQKLSTVGNSVIYGGRYYSMRIEPNNAKLFQYKISPFEIEQAVRAQNKDYPAGVIKSDVRNFNVRLNASLNKPEEFENIILKKFDDGTLVKLSDVARVALEPADNDVILRYNSAPSMAVGLIKQSTANILELSDSVKTELVKIRQNLPAGVKVDVAFDSAVPVRASINEVFFTIFEAIALVGIVTYIFLGSAKITLIPLVTIPISLVGTFTAMYFLGFSINTFTLLAMILAIGLVVDDAIVMLENIFRHSNELGKPPMQAALDASSEIGFAIVAMTITLASVFLPIGFIEGFLGKLFIEFAWTLAFCVLFSGFVALTLTPMMTSRMIGRRGSHTTSLRGTSSDAAISGRYDEHYSRSPGIAAPPSEARNDGFTPSEARNDEIRLFDRFLLKVQNLYILLLNLAIRNKKKFFLICLGSVALLVLSFKEVGKIFVPDEDQGYLQIFFTGPEGSSVFESEKSVLAAEEYLKKDKDIFGYFDVIGFQGGETAMAFVPLQDWSKRKRSHDDIKNELNKNFANIPGMSIFAISPSPLGGGGGGDKAVSFNLQTTLEYDEFDKLSADFTQEMKNNPIFQNVERDFKSSTPTLDIIVDREKAYRYGVNLDTLGKTVQYLIAGRNVGDFRMGNDIYDVTLRYSDLNRHSPEDLRKVIIKTDSGGILPLESVATLAEKITVKSYNHYNTAKAIGISSDLAPGKNITEALAALDSISSQLLNKNNTNIEYLGEIKQMNESSSGTLVTFLFALIFIFLVLSAQFESFADSLLILMAVPFSITGGVLALWLFGNTINMYSNIGLVTLIGLVTKNSIMLVEFTNQLRHEGLSVTEAVVQSARLRLRPILMTSIATICGALPLVFASGAGAASRNSIGLVVVGGMLLGTLFTIFVIPVLYQTFKRERRS